MTHRAGQTQIPAQDVTLVYADSHGVQHTQPADDLVESGTLIDPHDDSDMELVGVLVNAEEG